jgi:Ribonucleotide reductase, barrel domain/Phosphofructokinase
MTQSDVRRVAVLTSGGDAPGMNAAIRAVIRRGFFRDLGAILSQMSVASRSDMRSSPPTAVRVARILEKYSDVKQVRLDPDRHTVNIGFYRLPSQSILAEIESAVRNELSGEWMLAEAMEKGSLKDVPDAPKKLKDLFVTALEIPAGRHLQIQAAFQRHVDNSVSKTINLPQDTTPNDIAYAYRGAWELGLKGITIYRYGSKSQQVLELGVGEEPQHYDYGSRCDPGECRV